MSIRVRQHVTQRRFELVQWSSEKKVRSVARGKVRRLALVCSDRKWEWE